MMFYLIANIYESLYFYVRQNVLESVFVLMDHLKRFPLCWCLFFVTIFQRSKSVKNKIASYFYIESCLWNLIPLAWWLICRFLRKYFHEKVTNLFNQKVSLFDKIESFVGHKTQHKTANVASLFNHLHQLPALTCSSSTPCKTHNFTPVTTNRPPRAVIYANHLASAKKGA